MTGSLFDGHGVRKYLSARTVGFCLCGHERTGSCRDVLSDAGVTGARISEVLALTAAHIDIAGEAIVFEILKQRKREVFRAVLMPRALIPLWLLTVRRRKGRLSTWGRTTGWKIVKRVMREAEIVDNLCKSKALRRAFAVDAGQKGIPLNIVQRWLGHARIGTTAIYPSAIGDKERNLACRAWSSIELAIPQQTDLSIKQIEFYQKIGLA